MKYRITYMCMHENMREWRSKKSRKNFREEVPGKWLAKPELKRKVTKNWMQSDNQHPQNCHQLSHIKVQYFIVRFVVLWNAKQTKPLLSVQRKGHQPTSYKLIVVVNISKINYKNPKTGTLNYN